MKKSRCPHCRQRLGNYLYATQCPFCQQELPHNYRQNDSVEAYSSHTPVVVAMAGIAIFYALLRSMGVLMPGLGESASVAGHVLRVLVAGLVGAAMGLGLSLFMARQAE